MLPVGAGPGQPYDNYAPLVIYGDTSQDGVWYGGDPHTQSLHNFGPKPMPHIEGATVDARRPRTTTTGDDHADSCTGRRHRLGLASSRDGFAVGRSSRSARDVPAIVAAGVVYDIYTDHLTLPTRHVGHRRLPARPAGHDRRPARHVDGHRRRLRRTVLAAERPDADAAPERDVDVTAVSQYVGIVKAVTTTTITLNLALSVADFPSGPHFPVAAGGTQTIARETSGR